MEKTCIKCGYTHNVKNMDSLAECPRCGVIYKKAESVSGRIEHENRQEVDDQKVLQRAEITSTRRSSFINFLVLGILACLFLYYYFGNDSVKKHGKQVARKAVKQKILPEPVDIVQRRPLPAEEDFETTEKEDDMELARTENETKTSEPQESNISRSIDKPPDTITRKISADYYMPESTISHGEKVFLNDHMSDRRFTVFYFYADW